MAPRVQWNLPPMALNKVASDPATVASAQAIPGNKVASVTLAHVIATAAAQIGMDLGDVFDLSLPEVSKNFGPNNPDRNRLMKVDLPLPLARQIALVLCEKTGLAVGGPDAERHALADLLTKCADYIRVMGAGR